MLRSLSPTLAVVIVLTFPVHAIVDDNHRGHWYRVHGGYHEKWREHGRWGEHGRWAQHGPWGEHGSWGDHGGFGEDDDEDEDD